MNVAGKTLAIIPARGGSKGVPGKNLRNLGAKPLIAWTIEAALSAKSIDYVIVSSDSSRILDVAAAHGAQILERPAHLALDDTPGIEPIIHAVETLDLDFSSIVCLQPTSPLRKAKHIDAAIQLRRSAQADSCVSVTDVTKPPHWMYYRNRHGTLSPYEAGKIPTRRQETPELFVLNGAIYITTKSRLVGTRSLTSGKLVGYSMDAQSSVDIDTEHDFLIAEALSHTASEPTSDK